MERLRHVANILSPWFWALSAGVVFLYLFGLIMGAFTPGELLGWTIVAVILAVLVGWHAHKVRIALRQRDPEVMRGFARQREKRGF